MNLPQRKRVGLPIRQCHWGNESYKGQGCGSYAVVSILLSMMLLLKLKLILMYDILLDLSLFSLLSIP
jgi:hypothetical protein